MKPTTAHGVTDPGRSPWLLSLLLLLALQCVLSAVVFRGYHGGDDYRYTVLAAEVIQDTRIDTSGFPPYFGVRWGLLLPMAASFDLFGINELAAVIPQAANALLGTVAMFVLAFLLLGRPAAMPAAALYALMPYTLRSSGLILADFPAFHWSTVGLALLVAALRSEVPDRLRPLIAAASAIAFSASWFSKSSVMCLAPVIAVLLVSAVRRDRSLGAAAAAFIGVSSLCLVGELVYYSTTRGDMLYRLTALEETISDFEHLWAGMVSPRRYLLDGPRSMLSHGAYGPVVWAAVALTPVVLVRRQLRPLAVWFLYLFLFFNFMTTSFAAYKPIRPSSLYFFYITQPAILMAVAAIFEVTSKVVERARRIDRVAAFGSQKRLSAAMVASLCLLSAAI